VKAVCEEAMFNGDVSKEDLVRERVDEKGNTWKKVYFGGGTHFSNWLEQVIELRGKENVEVEEADSKGLKCFEEGGEKVYRIWVKDRTHRHSLHKTIS
jgi:hypothetical protein